MYRINLAGPRQQVITQLGSVDARDPVVGDARAFIGRMLDKSKAEFVGVTLQESDTVDGGKELRLTFAEHGVNPHPTPAE
jgi:hypothetical protein